MVAKEVTWPELGVSTYFGKTDDSHRLAEQKAQASQPTLNPVCVQSKQRILVR